MSALSWSSRGALPPESSVSGVRAHESPTFVEAVDARLAEFLAERSQTLLDVSPDLQPVVERLAALASGGKRLRASFCFWGWRAAGGAADDPAVVDAAASLELFHLAALVHDDMMDHSRTRRGLPAVHEAFAADHTAQGFDGDAADFGAGAALLVGDLCLTWSDELLDGSTAHRDGLRAARSVYHLMRSQVITGQYLDMLAQARPRTDEQASLTVLRFKSAKYTVEHPLLLGAALAGGTDDVLTILSAYGLPVGEAFQLRDDVLGAFGDSATTGKPTGDDFREGKKTLLVVHAVEHARPDQLAVLRRGLGDRDLDEDGVRVLQDVLVVTGAVEAAEQQIVDLTHRGIASLRTSGVPLDIANALADLARTLVGRDR